MKYIIIYDIPREKKVLQVRVNRALRATRAEKLQHSVWESDNLRVLKNIAGMIRLEGGEAIIIEKKVIF